jgi:hypothetical protein
VTRFDTDHAAPARAITLTLQLNPALVRLVEVLAAWHGREVRDLRRADIRSLADADLAAILTEHLRADLVDLGVLLRASAPPDVIAYLVAGRRRRNGAEAQAEGTIR